MHFLQSRVFHVKNTALLVVRRTLQEMCRKWLGTYLELDDFVILVDEVALLELELSDFPLFEERPFEALGGVLFLAGAQVEFLEHKRIVFAVLLLLKDGRI